MMRKFQVTVNGNTYEVEVEELGGSFTPVATPVTPVAATPVAAVTPKMVAPKATVVPANATKIVAPMPGKIVDVKVSIGQSVKEGDLVAILEAMKMENEIFAPSAGTVASVNVSAGTAVETNDVIVTLN
ncbi:biotin/lipoyl-containing protein [Cellulosilyticum sp. WCF-2]|uniref:Biotin/lipoyl attachment domain-containing protein n=2 Tax=Cellulosilyticaceae TaxID=3018741 RepID=F2JS40_CELLD|nr:biotin/lipoyl-containing protein [Cellulosilyticum lentocellum]ADZ83977.1 biotin/lipoyl attachment domain-containing protein [Cellulosilyticum lentocellum DSM 5427]